MTYKINRITITILQLTIFLLAFYIFAKGRERVTVGNIRHNFQAEIKEREQIKRKADCLYNASLRHHFQAEIKERELTKEKADYFYNASSISDVLLFGYMRGESTFVGHIIGCRPDTFYFYEPFWSISKTHYYTKDKSCYINKAKCRKYKDTSLIISRTIRDLYKCDSATLYQMVSSVQSQHSCQRNREEFKTKNIPKLRDLCLKAKTRVTKILRISAEFVKEILKLIPSLKIVYLHRDSRAIITSRRKHHKGPLKTTMVSAVCKKMCNDCYILRDLSRMFPARVIFLSAERMAKYPVKSTKSLFKQLGLEFTKGDLKQINNLSNLDKKQNRTKNFDFSPFKKDGFIASMAWRQMLTISDKTVIDRLCQSAYNCFGYLNMSSVEQFRNINEPNIIYL